MYKEFGPAKDDLLASGQKIFYKFSKSNQDLANQGTFFENAYTTYPENSIVTAGNEYGLSFCMKPEKVLACARYGDVLTQVVVDPDKMSARDLKKDKYEYCYREEWEPYAEIRAQRIHTGKNFSIADPSVLKECMMKADEYSLSIFFGQMAAGTETMEVLYGKLGYIESKNMVEAMRPYYSEYIAMGDNITAFRQKLEELYPTKENDFTFEKANMFYEQQGNIGEPPFGRDNQIGEPVEPPKPIVYKTIEASYARDMLAHFEEYTKLQENGILDMVIDNFSEKGTMPETYPMHLAETYNVPKELFEQYLAEHPLDFIEDRPKPAQVNEAKLRLGDDLFDKLDKTEAPQRQSLLSRFISKAKETLHIDGPQQSSDDRDEL